MKNVIAARKAMEILPQFFKQYSRPVSNIISSIISPIQYILLREISMGHNTIMSDISKIGHISKQHATQVVNNLIANGYVERKVNEKDRRIINVYITDAGIEIVKKVDKALQNMYADVMSNLDEEHLDTLIYILDESSEILESLSKHVNAYGEKMQKVK